MHIGLISDTHIPAAAPNLWPEIYEALRGCELILHAGDIYVVEVLDWLGKLAPVLAARGNGDERDPADPHARPGVPEDERVSLAHILRLQGFRVGLAHCFDTVEERPWMTTDQQMHEVFGEPVDIVVCGHSHVPLVQRCDNGVVIVNPGSATLPHNYMPQLGTVAYLDLEPGSYRASILDLASGLFLDYLEGKA